MLYGRHPFFIDPEFADFHVELCAPKNLRRWMHRQAEFLIDGESPFEPLPRDQAPAMLEWGMNWAIASFCHQWLTIHAASLERNGQVVILPAPPGSGKSTLCAASCARFHPTIRWSTAAAMRWRGRRCICVPMPCECRSGACVSIWAARAGCVCSSTAAAVFEMALCWVP